jgi:diguanylate cyclase (GGDEF)-like protein
VLLAIVGWIWPGALLFVGGLWFLSKWGDAVWFSQALPLYAPVVFGVGLFLAWRFTRSRVGAVLVGLALLNYLPGLGTVEVSVQSQWEVGGLILVILIGVLSVLKDRGMSSRLGIIQPLVAAIGVSMGWALTQVGWPAGPAWVWRSVIPGGLIPWSGLPDATILAGVASLTLAVGMSFRRDQPVEKGLFWALLATVVALTNGAESDGSAFFLMVAGLILTIAVLETSHAMAFRDELTGLPARRALWQELDSVGRLYAVGMVDVDHFKRFNDRHGHDVGDQVLRRVASQLRKGTGGGRAFRYGGEEFTIVYPGKNSAEAHEHLEALRKSIEESEFTVRRLRSRRRQYEDPKAKKKATAKFSVTVSTGFRRSTCRTGASSTSIPRVLLSRTS